MFLSYRYDFINESRANRFRIYELFDMNKLIDELNNISIEIEHLGFNISAGWKTRPSLKDQLYEHPTFRWELICQIKLPHTRYNVNIIGAFDGVHFNLYEWDGGYINDKNLKEFVFGDINRNSIFTKDVYSAPIIIKDLIQKLKQYKQRG